MSAMTVGAESTLGRVERERRKTALQTVICCVTRVMGLQWDRWSDEPFSENECRGGNNMARVSTMKCLLHHAPFISCVVFLLVTLKFLRSCFDNTKKKKTKADHQAGLYVLVWESKESSITWHPVITSLCSWTIHFKSELLLLFHFSVCASVQDLVCICKEQE